MRAGVLLIYFLTSCFLLSYAQSFEEKIKTVYSFKIADLTAKDLEAKYKQLDNFWQELNADTTMYLPKVRKELVKPGYSSYFYFDMSSYLEMHSAKDADKRIIEKALKNILWTELSTWELIEKLRDFSVAGIDVTDVTFQLLKQDKVKIVNPDTGETFNQGKILAYLLLPLKRELYLKKIVAYFEQATPESQRSIVTLLWMTNTTVGKKQLETIASTCKDIDVRSYASRLIKRFPPSDVELAAYKDLLPDVRKITLTGVYNKALLNWDLKSWDQLILCSKLMHYYECVVE